MKEVIMVTPTMQYLRSVQPDAMPNMIHISDEDFDIVQRGIDQQNHISMGCKVKE